jgi:hypothetical protein
MLEIYRKGVMKLTQYSRLTHVLSHSGVPRPIWRWRVFIGCCALLSPAGYMHFKQHMGRPEGQPAQAVVDTATGVVALRNAGVEAFERTLPDFVWDGGILTDELTHPLHGIRRISDLPVDADTSNSVMPSHDIWRRLNSKDVRIVPERQVVTGGDNMREANLDRGYLKLQAARAVLSTAIGQIATATSAETDPAVGKAFRGELYALLGYTEVMLADLFCSGVPLNTYTLSPTLANEILDMGNAVGQQIAIKTVFDSLVANRTIAYHPSSTTTQVYWAALAKFDTALSLAGDSTRILNLARVGKGRVWLALGQYDSAAAAVARVPQGFVYRLPLDINLDGDWEEVEATVADREGGNGLPYISSGDPRTETEWISTDKVIRQVRVPSKYLQGGDLLEGFQRDPTTIEIAFALESGHKTASGVIAPFTAVSWEEAVLIRAEAALHKQPADPTWLRLLNQLRATAPIPGTTRPNPARLVPLKDPGTKRGRISMLFAERAYWLFLTGHRQGDLRRLVRQYRWPQQQVYPTGSYIVPQGLVGQVGQYGTDVNLPIPPEERANPNFHGCLDRGA